MSNNSGSNTNRMAVPQAKEAMNRFKQEVADYLHIPITYANMPGWEDTPPYPLQLRIRGSRLITDLPFALPV